MSKQSEEKLKTFNEFHSQRSGSAHLFPQKQHSQIKKLSQDRGIKLLFPIHHAVHHLLLQFQNTLTNNNYQCLFVNQKQIFISSLSFKDKLKKMFLCRQPAKFILIINTHQFIGMRSVTIKSLKANQTQKYDPIASKQLGLQIQKISQIIQNTLNSNPISCSQSNEQNTDYKYDIYSLDAISYYTFSKMLTDQKYTLGQKISVLNHHFSQTGPKQHFNKKQMNWLNHALNQISDTLLQGFNCSKKELTSILAFCRQSVQKYFENIHEQTKANQQKILSLQSQQFTRELRQLSNILPFTSNQLQKLQRTSISIYILNILYMIGLMFNAECSIHLLDNETKNHCLFLIKTCYSNTIRNKINILKKSGYEEQDYRSFIQCFYLEEATPKKQILH